jgi:hypothetical protein
LRSGAGNVLATIYDLTITSDRTQFGQMARSNPLGRTFSPYSRQEPGHQRGADKHFYYGLLANAQRELRLLKRSPDGDLNHKNAESEYSRQKKIIIGAVCW